MSDSEKNTFTCKTCGREIAESDVRRCSVCLKKRCPGCVIEIAGRTVCTDCKDWALSKMEEGLPLKPDGMLFASAAEISRKRRDERARRLRGTTVEKRERRPWSKAVGKPRACCLWPILVFIIFFIAAVLFTEGHDLDVPIVLLFLAVIISPLVWLYGVFWARAQVMLFYYDDSGVEAQNFAGGKILIPWTAVDKITFGANSMTIKAPGRRITLRKNMFTHYGTIRGELFKRGKSKGIAVVGYK